MSSNVVSDQHHLTADENDNPPAYEDAINQYYGTFISSTTPVNAYPYPYPYAFNSEQPGVIVSGGCPICKAGMIEYEFTCCGLCCALVFFPIGILCCLALRRRRCSFCGAIFH